MRYALLTERRKKERRTQEKQDTSVCNGCVRTQEKQDTSVCNGCVRTQEKQDTSVCNGCVRRTRHVAVTDGVPCRL